LSPLKNAEKPAVVYENLMYFRISLYAIVVFWEEVYLVMKYKIQ